MAGTTVPSSVRQTPSRNKGAARVFVGLTAWMGAGLMLCWLSAGVAWAQVAGLIVGPGTERFRLAVSPLKNLGGRPDSERLSERIADVMADDLDRSGWFEIVDRSAYIEDPQKTGIRLGGFDFRDWTTIGAEGLIKGGFRTLGGGRVRFEFRLYDTFRRSQVVGKAYAGEVQDARRMAHRFVDEIILKLTGTRGVFDSRIAYVSTGKDRFKEIYFSHLDGTEKKRVTHNRTINMFPWWRRDGKGLVYLSVKTGKWQVFGFDLLTQREKAIARGDGRGHWSPDGQHLATPIERSGNHDIYRLNRSGDIVERMTHHPGIDTSPTWSPKGDRIAFSSDRHGSLQIYVLEVATGAVRRLTFKGSYNTSPDWSPTGELIAFTGRTNGVMKIFTIRPDGSDLRMLTSNRYNDEDPSWSPDGRFLAFTSNRSGSRRIYTMRRDGESQRRLTGSTAGDTNPSWSPRLQ